MTQPPDLTGTEEQLKERETAEEYRIISLLAGLPHASDILGAALRLAAYKGARHARNTASQCERIMDDRDQMARAMLESVITAVEGGCTAEQIAEMLKQRP